MKVRNGFVSNSSSSSFVVSFDPSKFTKCGECGHERDTPLDLANYNNSCGDESYVQQDNADTLLECYSYELKELVSKQRLLVQRNPNQPLVSSYPRWKVGQQLECNDEEITEIHRLIDAIRDSTNSGLQVVSITLSEHTNKIALLQELVEEGIATLISGELDR